MSLTGVTDPSLAILRSCLSDCHVYTHQVEDSSSKIIDPFSQETNCLNKAPKLYSRDPVILFSLRVRIL